MSTLSKKGQVTIPREARKQLGIVSGDRVLFKVEDGHLVLVRVEKKGLCEVLDAQKAWPMESLRYQRRLRNEWASKSA